MVNTIVLFPKAEDARAIKNLLVKTGFNVVGVCTTGAQAAALTDDLNDGIVVCGYKYADMMYNDLREILPECFDMLLVASKSHWEECIDNDIVCVEMPIKVRDLIDTLSMMTESVERRRRTKRLMPKERTPEEEQIIEQAKALLMERNNMSEEEAHRYIQKTSMDTGTNIVETSQMVLDLMT